MQISSRPWRARIFVGDEKEYFDKGKVLIAAANPDMMEYYIEENDLVILGNRYESQLCAIEMGASCIIVCEGAGVSMTIKNWHRSAAVPSSQLRMIPTRQPVSLTRVCRSAIS